MLRSDRHSVALTCHDLIFWNRHQACGTSNLRRQHRPTLTHALTLGVGLFLAGMAAPAFYVCLFPAGSSLKKQTNIATTFGQLPKPPGEEAAGPPVDRPITRPVLHYSMPVISMDAPEDMPVTTIVELAPAVTGPATGHPVIDGETITEVIPAPEAPGPTRVETCGVEPEPEVVFVVVERQPEYPGGVEALQTFLSKNLRYPRSAKSAGVSGRVFVSFVVNTDGSLADVNVVKRLGSGYDEEAVRVVKQMPRWKPGRQSGRAVRVKYNLPISFALE